MLKKLKLYLRHNNKNEQYRSFLDEMDRFKEFTRKIKLNTNPEKAFLGILKVFSSNAKTTKPFIEWKEGDKIKFIGQQKGNWKIIENDCEQLSYMMELELNQYHKIWVGFNFIRQMKQVTLFNYYEGYMSTKINFGLPKLFMDLDAKKNLKLKCLALQNEVNKII